MLDENQEIPQGGIIFQEKPFVYVLCSKFRSELCDFCFSRQEQLLKCSTCRYVYYCGKACQKYGWSIHKLECKQLKRISPRILPDAGRILARLMKILENGGNSTKSYITKTSYRMFKDLMSHYTNLKKDKNKMDHFFSLYGVLAEFFAGEQLPNSTSLMEMYGKMCINSFSICNQEFQCLGTGIYLAASIVDHSCKPNAIVIFEGTTLIMRALENIPVLDWSKIFISYIDVIADRTERQLVLETTYYFLCQCPKCIEVEPFLMEMKGAACPNPQCNNCIDSSSMQPGQKCIECDQVITEPFIKTFQDVVEMTDMRLRTVKESSYLDLDICNGCLDKHRGVLYKHNVKHVKILDLAFDSSIEHSKFDEAIRYGLELIESFHKYYGKNHPMTGLLHLKLGKLLLYHNETKRSLENLKKAKEILEITHGTTSSLFKKHLIPLLQQAMM